MSSVRDDIVRSRVSKLSANSRYKLTRLYADKVGGRSILRWGVWNRPNINMSQYYNYLVRAEDVGRLDRISKKFYGNENLWWAIADVNGIKNVFTDVIPGSVIKIPLLSNIEQALSEGRAAFYD